MIYLDSSALVKLVFEERESAALAEWLAGHGSDARTSSALAVVEVLRTCRQIHPGAQWVAEGVVGGLDLVPVELGTVDRAATLEPIGLRSLDALHLAAALSVAPAITAFVCYNHRLSDAARTAGLPVVAPA